MHYLLCLFLCSYSFFYLFVCGCVTDTMKVSPYRNVDKQELSKDDQLSLDVKNLNLKDEVSKDGKSTGKRAETFTFEELAAATGNFRSDCFLGEGGFGKVYKGHLEKINQVGSCGSVLFSDVI